MPALTLTDYRYRTEYLLNGAKVYRVLDGNRYLDSMRTETAAAHACNMLARGVATIDTHAPVGCRIVPL